MFMTFLYSQEQRSWIDNECSSGHTYKELCKNFEEGGGSALEEDLFSKEHFNKEMWYAACVYMYMHMYM